MRKSKFIRDRRDYLQQKFCNEHIFSTLCAT